MLSFVFCALGASVCFWFSIPLQAPVPRSGLDAEHLAATCTSMYYYFAIVAPCGGSVPTLTASMAFHTIAPLFFHYTNAHHMHRYHHYATGPNTCPHRLPGDDQNWRKRYAHATRYLVLPTVCSPCRWHYAWRSSTTVPVVIAIHGPSRL